MITEELAQNAIDSTARRIREYLHVASIYKTLLTSSAVGKVLNRSIIDRVSPLFPGWRIGYYKQEHGLRWVDLRFTRMPDDLNRAAGPLESYTVTIGNDKTPRLNRDFLTVHAAEYTDNANKLKASLADFSDALAQYNNLLPYYESLRARLYPVMHTLRNYHPDIY